MEENKRSGEQRLIERVLKKRSGGSLMKEEFVGENSKRKLTDSQALIKHAREAINEKLINPDKLEKCRKNNHRTQVMEAQFPIANVVYSATAPIWRNIIRSSIDGLAEDLHVRQPNAKWKLCDAEMQVISKLHKVNTGVDESTGRELWEEEDVEYLLVAMEYVDERGEQDLQYRDGRPLTGERLDFQGLAPELAEAMARIASEKQGPSPQSDQMQQLLDQNAALMARLEALETANAPKTRKSRKPKEAAPEAEVS